MSTYNKNVSNQSGLSIDNINVKNTVYLPSGATITSNSDSVLTSGNQSISGTKTFTETIISNNGYNLPSIAYILNSNAIGYTITAPNNSAQQFVNISSNSSYSAYSLTLPLGVWLVTGQFEYYSNSATSLNYSEIMTTLTTSISTTSINYNKNIASGTIIKDDYIINQVSGVFNNTTSSTNIVLSGRIQYSSGQAIFKYIPSSVTTGETPTSNSYTFTLLFSNDVNLILIGMILSSPTNGIITGKPIVTNRTGASITVSIPQSIPEYSILYFNFPYPRSYLKAVRLG